MPDLFTYDVFLSHSSRDKAVVRELAERLKRDGLRVWFDEWEIKPGVMIGKAIDDGIEASRVLVLCMSAHAFGADWVSLESGTFRYRDPANKERRLIPLRLDDAEIRGSLAQFAYVDWRRRDSAAYDHLLEACRGAPSPNDARSSPVASDAVLPRMWSLGHTAPIRSVAWSPDDRHVISGSDDGTVRVWEVKSGRCVGTLQGHTDRVWSVTWSPDGRRALSGSWDRTLRVWEVESGRCVGVLQGHTKGVMSVAWSPDGRSILSGSGDTTVRIWDVKSGHCVVLVGHVAGVLSVAWSPDGRRALSASDDMKVRMWEVESGQCIGTLHGHVGSVLSVAWNAHGQLALTGSSDKTVRVWEVETGRCINTLEGHSANVWSVAWSPDGARALSSSGDKTMRVWDVRHRGRCVGVMHGHTGSVSTVAWSPDGRRALSGSDDTTVRVWEMEGGRFLETMQGHTGWVLSVAWSPDGRRALSGSYDNTVRVWEVESGRHMGTLHGHAASVTSVAWSPDARRALSGSSDKTVRVWDVESGRCLRTLEGHSESVMSVVWSPDGKLALSGSSDKTVRVWDVESGRCVGTLHGHAASVTSVAWSPDGLCALSGSDDKTVRVWEVKSGRCVGTLSGHAATVHSVAWSADGLRALSGSYDKTVRVWEVKSGRCVGTLQGHTESVTSVAWGPDGRYAVSGSDDKTLRVWDAESGRCVGTLQGHSGNVHSVAWSAHGRRALSGARNGVAAEWTLDVAEKLPLAELGTRYTNAKVLMTGDTGVGKSGLARRLIGKEFVPTDSTDGAWATQMKLPHCAIDRNLEREIWLWDFAGQQDYRILHQLFMDEAALAVVVFNPQSDNPFEGLGQWDRDLQRAARRPFQKLLVAGRCDVGGLTVSRESIEQFRKERGFVEYLETSAKSGDGCLALREAIVRHIDWEQISFTATTRTFKLLNDEILRLRDEGHVLLRMVELKQHLHLRLPTESFTDEELRAVVGLLAGPGVVWKLEFGDFVLLHPERISAYAAAVMRSVRSHKEEIGCIAEEDVLVARFDFLTTPRLPPEEERIVLQAMRQTFVDHGLCLREHTDKGALLIFPSYFKRERPPLEQHPLVLVTYQFSGSLDEIYTTLVVRLHHTGPFDKDRLWRFAADFKTAGGKRLGFKLTKKGEGDGELEVYFEPGIADDLQVTFIRYVHDHLTLKGKSVVRLRHYVCPHCGSAVENRRAIDERLRKGLKDILCVSCERRVPLWDLIEEKFASEEFQRRSRELEEQAKAAIDNESRELILVGHAYAIAGEAGQIYRQYTNSDHGIDGEIEFKDHEGNASGKRLYLQLKSGDSYLHHRKKDDVEIFRLKNERWADYWRQQAYPVMLVIRTSDGAIRWMNVTDYLERESQGGIVVKQIEFEGDPFSAISLRRMRERVLGG